jgi:hypothetical protein
MHNLRIAPQSTLTEGQVLDPMFDGFRATQRQGKEKVNVTVSGDDSFVFEASRSQMNPKVFYGYLYTNTGAIAACAHFDEFDL